MAEAMTAAELITRLWARYPSERGEWASFTELRNGTGGRHSRAIDFAAFNVWPSKGFRSVAHEVKVSRADFMRELEAPDKRAWCEDQFTECLFVTPKGLVLPGELPLGWGLLEPWGSKLKLKRAPRQSRENRIDPATVLSVLRRANEHGQVERARLAEIEACVGEYRGRSLKASELMSLIERGVQRQIEDRRLVIEMELNAKRREQGLERARVSGGLQGWLNCIRELRRVAGDEPGECRAWITRAARAVTNPAHIASELRRLADRLDKGES